MLVTKNNPTGLDYYIQQAQAELYQSLLKVWGADVNYTCYGRAYRNRTADITPAGRNRVEPNYIAEIYTGSGSYREPYWDSTLDAISFFGTGSQISQTKANSLMDVHLIFFVNLSRLKPSVTHRADVEVRQDVQSALGVNAYGLEYQSTELWIENVLREYPGTRRNDSLKYVDMSDVHCFRLNYQLSFNPNKKSFSTFQI